MKTLKLWLTCDESGMHRLWYSRSCLTYAMHPHMRTRCWRRHGPSGDFATDAYMGVRLGAKRLAPGDGPVKCELRIGV